MATLVSGEELEAIETEIATGSVHPGVQKRRLARAVIEIYHGPEAAIDAEAAFDRVFKRHEAPVDVPSVEVDVTDPIHLPALLKELGFAPSNAEARRLIDGGAIKIDGTPVAARCYDVAWAAVGERVLQAGKRHFARPVARS
jgi:tyrosyl-tRNA synthetase